MPFENEHRARQASPDQFESFRRTKPDGYPSGIEAILGIRKDGGSEIQSLVFDAKEWTPDKAKKWLDDHDFTTALEEATNKEDSIQFRLDDLPSRGANIRSVRRWDLMPLEKPKRTDEGFVRAQGMITRSGVFEYQRRDGSISRELRPPEEVFRADSLRTFSLVPLTLDHPPDNLSPETAASHQVGAIGSPTRIGSHVRADLLITRKDAIEAVMNGKNKLSCGYTCQVVDRGGTFVDSDGNEHKFDAIQTGIVGNHVAICDNPRAGPSAQIRIDSADAFAEYEKSKGDSKVEFEEITINGNTYKVPKDVAAKMRTDGALNEKKSDDDGSSKAIAEAQAERDKARGELAAIKAKHEDEEKKRADDKQKSDAHSATKKRISLCAVAAPVLEKKLDEILDMEDVEIMKAVIEKEAPDMKLDDKSEAFIEGVFASITTNRIDTSKEITKLVNQGRKTAKDSGGDDAQKRADEARQRMMDRQRNGWKPEALRKLERENAS